MAGASHRANRFKRPGRSFHSPFAQHVGGAASDYDDDLELGALLTRRGPVWTQGDDHSNEDGDDMSLAESESEEKVHLGSSGAGKRYRLRKQHQHAAPTTTPTATPFDLRKTYYGQMVSARRRGRRGRLRARMCSRLSAYAKTALMTLGLVQCLLYVSRSLESLFPDELDLIAGPIRDSFVEYYGDSAPGRGGGWTDRLHSITADVQPFMCHSHNDYWRREPLYQAVHAGCTGVEADVWMLPDDDEALYVSHTLAGVQRNRTLESLYLGPLMQILDQKNAVPDFMPSPDQVPAKSRAIDRVGVFDTRRRQSLVLLIDFKPSNDYAKIWHRLESSLAPFRDKRYLTHFNGSHVVDGPLTIVVSGHAPYRRVVANETFRDVFFDAPLHLLSSAPGSVAPEQRFPDDDESVAPSMSPSSSNESMSLSDRLPPYSSLTSYYASTSFRRAIGPVYHSSLTQLQLQTLRHQIRTAHDLGLKVRYWNIPTWPVGVRNYIWRVLVREGVDYLSVDQIEDVGGKDWGPRKGGWGKKWWR